MRTDVKRREFWEWRDHTPGGQALGHPGGLTNLLRRQPVWMLAEQGDNDVTALLNIGACSRAVLEPRDGQHAALNVQLQHPGD